MLRLVTDHPAGEQRWLLVLYEPNRERELKQIEKAIGKERQQVAKALKLLQRQTFACAHDAQQALERAGQGWHYHRVQGQVQAHTQYLQAGRPGPRHALPNDLADPGPS